MKKNMNLFILLFTLFIPKVYGLTYDVDTEVNNISDNNNSLYEIKVSLKNINNSSYGIGACTLNIMFSDGIELRSPVRSLGGWSLTKGKIYLLDIGNPVKNNSDLFTIPVKVNKDGNVKIIDIECSDDVDTFMIEDRVINLKYEKNNNVSSNTNTNTNTNTNVVKDSNCNLSNIDLSSGNIDFQPDITDYYINVDNIDNLEVIPHLSSDKASYVISKDNDQIIIKVTAENGNEKIYTIYVENVVTDEIVLNEELNTSDKNNKSSSLLFIIIIVILILVNVYRIVKIKRNENKL